jgi:hypothetical protein
MASGSVTRRGNFLCVEAIPVLGRDPCVQKQTQALEVVVPTMHKLIPAVLAALFHHGTYYVFSKIPVNILTGRVCLTRERLLNLDLDNGFIHRSTPSSSSGGRSVTLHTIISMNTTSP